MNLRGRGGRIEMFLVFGVSGWWMLGGGEGYDSMLSFRSIRDI